MEQAVAQFIDELRSREDSLGIAVFGSYARGDGRPDSDVDVFVLVPEGVRRDVERRDGRNFEMVYASEREALNFYKDNPDDCVQMWGDAMVLHDPHGTLEKLRAYAAGLREAGKPQPGPDRLKHQRFDAEDKLKAVRYLAEADPPTAVMYLHQLAHRLLELAFDRAGLWTPDPKQRLRTLRAARPETAELFDELYASPALEQQLDLCEKMIERIFDGVPSARR